MNFYIFRHGETFATKDGVPYGKKVVEAPILAEGIPVIERLAQYLKNIRTDYNVRSEFKRVKQTADIVTKITGKVFEADKRLNDVILFSPEIGDLNKQAETPGEFIKRISDFLEDISSNNYESVLIATHGWPIGALKYLITKGNVTTEELYDFPRPGILTIIKNGELEEIDFN